MISKRTQYWLLGLGAIWMLFGRTINTLLNLGFRLDGFRIVSLSEDNTTFQVDIAIKNPTRHVLTVKGIDCMLKFNGDTVANIDQAVNRKVAAKAVTVVTIQATVRNTVVLNKLIEQLNTGVVDNWALTLTGSMSIDNSYYPFNLVWYAEDIL